VRLTNQEWQREGWEFYHNLGTFRYAILWHSQTMSRVRLTAAVEASGGDEPEPVIDGPAAELMANFFGGTAGQSAYMRKMDVMLQVPGEGYVIGEPDIDDPSTYYWCVKSIDQMRVSSGRVNGETQDVWEIEVDRGAWRPVNPDSLVFRQWTPDDQYDFLPDSPTRGALLDMRLIAMLQKRIVAQSVSRLASNGVLLYPSEMTFPAKKGYEQEEDPFTAEWLDIAGKTIQNPGSALAAIPMPVKVPKEMIDSFKHMDFANTYDDRVMDILTFFYDRLATAMNMPKEIVAGMGKTSHWNAWTLDEQAVEVHIKPPVEDIVSGATKGYLVPGLKAMGAPLRDAKGRRYIIWYDTSELDVPPDRSAAADAAYDRQTINATAYRREKGFSESDEPSNDELRTQLLVQMAKDPTAAPAAIEELTGSPVAGAQTGPGGTDAVPPVSAPAPAAGPPTPPTNDGSPPPGAQTPSRA
jgi:hypothetical protein